MLHGMDSNTMVKKLKRRLCEIVIGIMLIEFMLVLLPVALWQARKQQYET
jgi:hypothetical protein